MLYLEKGITLGGGSSASLMFIEATKFGKTVDTMEALHM